MKGRKKRERTKNLKKENGSREEVGIPKGSPVVREKASSREFSLK